MSWFKRSPRHRQQPRQTPVWTSPTSERLFEETKNKISSKQPIEPKKSGSEKS